MHRMEGNRIAMLDIQKNGSIVERIPGVGQDSTTENTLLGKLYPDAKIAIVSVPAETLDDFEEATVARTLTGLRHNGVHLKMVGASGSAKNGKYYFSDAAHEPLLAKRFEMWPEAAITYFGILVSGLKSVHEMAAKTVFVVPDLKLGTNDCRGWIRRSLFLELGLPEGYFYQFRLAFENTQAKGSFKVMADDVADAVGCDIIVPESSVKPGLKKQSVVRTFFGADVRAFHGSIVLGIREISRPLTFESSYTVLQHAPVDAIATEIVPQAREKIDALKAAWRERNHQVLVEMIGSSVSSGDSDKEEFQRIVEATLLADGSGELTRHPYIHRQLDRLLARWAYKLMTGGGLDLPAFALADDGVLYLNSGKVMSAADWMPRDRAITSSTSERSLCVRYPVRMKEDLLPMVHLGLEETATLLAHDQNLSIDDARQITSAQLTLTGTYTLHSETAKLNGGDFDFDWVCVIESERFPLFVADRFAMNDAHEVRKTKHERVKSPWFNLEFVALKSRGNQIGVITDLMSSCVALARHDLLYDLVAELQKEIDSLKHNVRADHAKLHAIRTEVGSAPWLSLKNARTVSELPMSLEIHNTDRIGNLYNVLRKDIADLLEKPFPVEQFRGLITGGDVSEEMFQEVRMVNTVYAAGHGIIQTAFNQAKKARDRARDQVKVAIESGDQNSIKHSKRELAKANASFRRAEESTRTQSRSLQSIIGYWGQGKRENREGWCAALNAVVSRGKGMGSILFHAFPQEVVNAVAERTGGKKTTVQVKDKEGAVILQDGSFFFVRGTHKSFLFRLDPKTGSLVYTGQ
ncbi:MAG TPA: hypothetical protein VMU57_10670 [Edaphobacter sp.]|uniref:hypothetical protein n=1 Tax=Edaphobacter sp. TaxID=1934404 RepID=UPI002CA86480|nr:hypothetical protein [Edaphobacter sp.]HUZ95366.1 hypothetical protein [Edaphobacter sp.]